MRWLESEHLPVLRQFGLEIGQARSASSSSNQFGGLVIHQAGVSRGIENAFEAGRLGRTAMTIKILGARATDSQRLSFLHGGANLIGKLIDEVLHVRWNEKPLKN